MARDEIEIMSWNAQSILSPGTFGELQKAVEDSKPDIICLVETWLSPKRNTKLKWLPPVQKRSWL